MEEKRPYIRKKQALSVIQAQQVRRILADTMERFGTWHGQLAKTGAMLDRAAGCSAEDRALVVAVCKEVGSELAEARAAILAALIDAPDGLRHHSRVVDVEKALDQMDATREAQVVEAERRADVRD